MECSKTANTPNQGVKNMNGRTYSFFLGANAPTGFFSYYDDLIDLSSANEVYILKGGPGTGKSSFMRRVARRLVEEGLECEYVPCSSDPDSLDGAIFPEIGVAMVDGTSPHVVEPKYPYAVERYYHIGAFVDADALRPVRDDIVAATEHYRKRYPSAYRCISAAKAIDDDICRSVLTADAIERTVKRAQGVARREIRRTGHEPIERRRFLTANSPKGIVTLTDTVDALADRVYELSSDFGLVPHFLAAIRLAALEAGCEIVSCYSPMSPESGLEHLFIPALGLAFTCSATDSPYRRIHLDGYLDRELLRSQKQRIRFLRRTRSALMDEAVDDLVEAKRRHDELEKLYIPSVDFDSLTRAADSLANTIANRYLSCL